MDFVGFEVFWVFEVSGGWSCVEGDGEVGGDEDDGDGGRGRDVGIDSLIVKEPVVEVAIDFICMYPIFQSRMNNFEFRFCVLIIIMILPLFLQRTIGKNNRVDWEKVLEESAGGGEG
ncbi:predicted protein [Sclerotinia sclerotiorum 1980 UF-70]|uniref:Uncharacterized protein n=1 Tax=Sclerotinia sclerotiorum (strain ATCC 18683 / 1980 / Ss-1) TaxID=665079 RepID=A7EJ69_SCLS1|nr:predicted protein [Sclerotinia sclerotiorum 1980 UF-70]EDO02885.1 predicted protein [Sclerotinia sclerotiorum 1980 UF-70]